MTEKSSIEYRLEDIAENYQTICRNIKTAAEKSGRKAEDITLMAVTKTVQPIFINYALSLGITLIGENKVQELLSKLDFLNPSDVQKHIIGHLQSNKVKKIVDIVTMVESVDSVSQAEEISKQAMNRDKCMDILLEVNIGQEESKTGFPAETLLTDARAIAALPGVNIRGLMCVPPICEDETELRGYFRQTKNLFEALKQLPDLKTVPDVLSMGMSGDYTLAIEEGATLIRVGSALFGARRY